MSLNPEVGQTSAKSPPQALDCSADLLGLVQGEARGPLPGSFFLLDCAQKLLDAIEGAFDHRSDGGQSAGMKFVQWHLVNPACFYFTTITEQGASRVRFWDEPPQMRSNTRLWPMKPTTSRSK